MGERWWRDARQALAGLRRSRGLAAAAIVTLALGLGANFALFSALDAVLWRSLPVPNPRQIHLLDRSDRDARFSYPLIEDVRRVWGDRAELAAMTTRAYPFSAPGQGIADDEVRGQLVSGNFFSVLGLRPWRGRLLSPTDNAAPSGRAVAVVSYAFWLAQYHGAGALGTTLTLDRVPVEVVGISSPEFHGVTRGNAPQVWLPLRLQPRLGYYMNASVDSDRGPAAAEAPWADQAGISWLSALVRVPAGASAAGLAAQATAVAQRDLAPRLSQIHRAAKRARLLGERLELPPGAQGLNELAGRIAEPLWLLAAMAGFVLLVACLNIAMLLLARGAARQREYAIRLAVGAGRGALLRQALVEGVVLALAGGGAGLLLAFWGRAALLELLGVAQAPSVIAGGQALLVAFAVALSLAAGIAFSLAPGWRAGRVAPLAALQDRSGSGGRRRGGGLVVWQVAASLVLLIGAGLLARSFVSLADVNPGFATQGVLLAHIDPRVAGYQPAQLPALYRQIVARLDALPGIAASGLAYCEVHCQATGSLTFKAGIGPGRTVPTHGDMIDASYLEARGMRLVRGRDFNSGDRAAAPLVAIVNQTFARRYLPGLDPLRQIVPSWGGSIGEAQIVGVVADARLGGIREPPPPFVFYSLAQVPGTYVMSLAVRGRGSAAALAPEVRAALADLAPTMPVGDVTTMRAHLADSRSDAASLAKLSGGLALLALALACLGLYGVAAYGVARRGPEIGMRMALGARHGQVFGLIWGETLRATLVGAILGLALAWPLTRLARGLLFGVVPLDPWAWSAALAVLFAAASLAALAPALRAARLAPYQALRRE